MSKIDEYVENELKGKAISTQKTYCYNLQKFEKWLQDAGTDLEKYSRTDVQHYIDYLAARKNSASTINLVFCIIKNYSYWSGKKETVKDIRIVKAPNRKKEAPKALDRKERLTLLRNIDRSRNKRNYAIVMTFINTGIRLEELVELDREDIEIGERQGNLIIRHGKGFKEREVPLNAENRRAIRKYLEQRTDDKQALFLSNYGKRINKRSVQRIVEKYDINVHKLRHTFITQLISDGVDFATIQSLTGHESADMVLRYSWPSQKDKVKAVEELYSKQN